MQPQALKMYIGGRWVESESGKTFDAHNPATGEVIATLPEGTARTRSAIAAANENRHRISDMPVWDRATVPAHRGRDGGASGGTGARS
jgi:acyl-CoA reductase-like NAD-dependent aldehyde dehydrogenase